MLPILHDISHTDVLTDEQRLGSYGYRVESFHLDCTERLSLCVLGNQMLNAAARHAEGLGFGREALRRRQLAWVFSRLTISMDRYPHEFEQYTITTWVANVNRWFTLRQFSITNAQGDQIGFASSIWALMNLDTRHAMDIPDAIPYYEQCIPDAGKMPPCPEVHIQRVRIEEKTPVATFAPRFSDIDYNLHLNSIRYIQHFLDLLPLPLLQAHPVHRIDLSYSAECHYGEPIGIYATPVPRETENNLCPPLEYNMEMRRDSGTVACRCKIILAQDEAMETAATPDAR